MSTRAEQILKTVILVMLAASVVALLGLVVVDQINRANEVSRLKAEVAEIRQSMEALESENSELHAELKALAALGMDIAALKSDFADLSFKVTGRHHYDKNSFKYFAIGNSITWHCKCDYWWNEVGMAASKPENDYYHRVVSYLEETHGNVSSYVVNYAIWETQHADRAQTYTAIDPYLDADLDLITIQLSENASNLNDFVSDYKELIAHLQEKCPNATILLIDDFWNEYKSQLKKLVADSYGLTLVSLAEIRGKQEYKSAIDAIVYDENGEPHNVWHSGVADHPGDKGMEYIANAVIAALKSN